MLEDNRDVKQQLEEAASKAESLQTKLLEANKSNFLPKQKLDDYDLANKRFQGSLTGKTNHFKFQAEIEKLVKHLQVMKVEVDIQRAEAIQLVQALDGKQYEKFEKRLDALLTYANHWDWKDRDKYSNFNVKRENKKKPFINHLPPHSK